MATHKNRWGRKAAVLLMQASLLGSAALPAFAQAQEVTLSTDMPERAPGAKPAAKSLEAGIWADSAKAEHAARTNGDRNTDPALAAYVTSVEAKVAGPFADDIRVYVMDRPFFNASVGPNGYAEVWSGLLLRCETEDELAFVLGHETGHFRHSHSLRRYQEVKAGANTAMVLMLVIGVAAASAQYNNGVYTGGSNYSGAMIDLTYLGTIAVLMSYSRESEAQADAYGLTYARDAGYFPGAGADIWQRVIGEARASDYEKVRKQPARINVFGSHPLETQRIAALDARDRSLNGGAPAIRSEEEAKAARAAYREHIRPWLGRWLKDDLRRQDYGQTLYIIERLSLDGLDGGVLNFYRGEALRLRGTGDDLNRALEAYQTALNSPDAPAEAWRQMGDVYRHLDRPAQAREAYTAYLIAAPEAKDAWMVQDEIDTITKNLPAPDAEDAPPAPQPAAASETPAGGPTE